jgi:hypothetical protein
MPFVTCSAPCFPPQLTVFLLWFLQIKKNKRKSGKIPLISWFNQKFALGCFSPSDKSGNQMLILFCGVCSVFLRIATTSRPLHYPASSWEVPDYTQILHSWADICSIYWYGSFQTQLALKSTGKLSHALSHQMGECIGSICLIIICVFDCHEQLQPLSWILTSDLAQ